MNYAAGLDMPLRGKRIAFSPRLGHVERIDAEVEALVAAAVKRLEELGAHVKNRSIRQEVIPVVFQKIWWSGRVIFWPILPKDKRALLDPGLRFMADEANRFTKKQLIDANVARGLYGSQMRVFMDRYDFLVTPTLATSAFDVNQLSPLDDDGKAWMSWTPFSFPFNLTQQPAASVPCGFAAKQPSGGTAKSSAGMFDDRVCWRPLMPMRHQTRFTTERLLASYCIPPPSSPASAASAARGKAAQVLKPCRL